jgi:hypothetical protein
VFVIGKRGDVLVQGLEARLHRGRQPVRPLTRHIGDDPAEAERPVADIGRDIAATANPAQNLAQIGVFPGRPPKSGCPPRLGIEDAMRHRVQLGSDVLKRVRHWIDDRLHQSGERTGAAEMPLIRRHHVLLWCVERLESLEPHGDQSIGHEHEADHGGERMSRCGVEYD